MELSELAMLNNSNTTNSTLNNDLSKSKDLSNNLTFIIIIDSFFNTLSFFIIVFEIASIYVLKKCVLINDQIKTISQNLLMADMTLHAAEFTVAIFKSILQVYSTSGLELRLRLGVLYILLLMYCLMMMVVALDRFIAVRYPLRYAALLPASTVRKIIRSVWFLMTCVMLFPYTLGITLYCSLRSCGSDDQPLPFNQYFRMALSVLFVICDVVVVVLYSLIMVKAEAQKKRLRKMFNNVSHGLKLPGRRTMLIVGTFIVLYSPSMIYSIMFDIFQIQTSLVLLGIFYLLGFRFCTSIHSCISLYFYTYGMPECRMRFAEIFLFWSGKYKQMAQDMKVELFNIPVVEKNTTQV